MRQFIRSVVPTALLMGTFVFFSACGDSPTETSNGPASVRAVAGSGQTAVVASELSQPLVVEVKDGSGKAVSGVVVTWAISSGEGSLSSTSTTTDAKGRAQVTWTLGTKAGEQKVSAEVLGVSSGASFSAIAEAGPAAKVALSADTLRIDHHGGAAELDAEVVDAHGNPVTAATLSWTSTDTLIARVNTRGAVLGRRPGETGVRAQAGSIFAEAAVIVQLQPNPRCVVPTRTPTRGVVGGLPSFSTSVAYSNVRPPQFDMAEPAVGDFDRDGDEDIIIFTSNFPPNPDDGEVLFWRSTEGGFVDATQEVFGTEKIKASHTRQLEVRDLNGDGFLDVFAVQHGYDNSGEGAPELLLLSRGDGTMREMAATHLNPYRTGGYSHASAAGDIDCDDDVDVFAGSGGGTVHQQFNHLYVNNGVGSFTAEDTRLPSDAADPGQLQVTSSLLCDIDRDGDQDLFMGASHKAVSSLLLNNGFGQFRHADEPHLPNPRWGEKGNVIDAKCADVNLDGLPDLLLSVTYDWAYSPAAVELWMNEGDLVFREVTEQWIPNERTGDGFVWRITVRDFNLDGWPDFHLAYAGVNGDSPVYINRGGSGFTMVMPSVTYATPIDGDNDGRADLLWTGNVASSGEEYSPVLHRNR